jgi:iron complex outermembrane receptor protein
MIQKKQLAVAIAATFVAAGVAYAQQTPQKVEKVEVTGSNIKRTDVESVAPVDVITREQIERSGQPTIADVLRNVPANSGNSYSESFSNSFAPGASGLSLRGLGQKTTLVLINGRRTAGYGFAQNLQDTFVDLNSIPSSAVERIEVLKDGASAIYGSDAIAGVVNVILRKDYKGLEFAAGGGVAAGNGDYRFNATGGFGDLGRDKYSVLGVFDYYKRDLVMLNETDFGSSRDWRGRAGGGRNFTSLTGAGTWRQLTAANALTNNHQASASCRGTVLTAAQALAAGLIAAPLGNTAFTGTFCAKDFNDQFTALPSTERFGFLGRANVEFSSNLAGFAEVGLSRVNSFQKFQDPFFAGTTGLTQTAVGLRPFTYNINFAPGSAGNPFTSNARYVGVLGDMGTRDTDIQSDTFRLLAGLKYTFGSWDGDSAIGWSRNEVTALSLNRLRIDGVSSVFGVTAAPQPPIPTSNSSSYNLNNFTLNTDAVRNQIRADFPRKSTSELAFIDTRLSTEFSQIQLPGGPVGLAVGAEFRNEKMNDAPADIAARGLVMGQGITSTNAKRDSFAVFAEAGLPIFRSLEAQLAVRSDHYSDYGSSTVPKVGLKWKATPEFVLRANWGEGFRAPTLPEISPSVATFFTSVIDPVTNASTQISGVFAGNPNLKAETSKSTTIGAVFEPTRDFNMGLNWYQIDWRDQVAAASFQAIVNGNGIVNGVRRGIVTRDPATNAIVSVETNYFNQGKVLTSGLDFDANYRLNTLYGKLGFRVGGSYIESYKLGDDEYVGTNGNGSLPRIRGNATVSWEQGPWVASATANYIHSYYQVLLAGSYFTWQDQRFQTGTFGEKIGSRTTIDLFGSYEFNNKLKVSASVINVANKQPPYDPGASGTFLYDFTQYDVRGRAFRANLSYKFR